MIVISFIVCVVMINIAVIYKIKEEKSFKTNKYEKSLKKIFEVTSHDPWI